MCTQTLISSVVTHTPSLSIPIPNYIHPAFSIPNTACNCALKFNVPTGSEYDVLVFQAGYKGGKKAGVTWKRTQVAVLSRQCSNHWATTAQPTTSLSILYETLYVHVHMQGLQLLCIHVCPPLEREHRGEGRGGGGGAHAPPFQLCAIPTESADSHQLNQNQRKFCSYSCPVAFLILFLYLHQLNNTVKHHLHMYAWTGLHSLLGLTKKKPTNKHCFARAHYQISAPPTYQF